MYSNNTDGRHMYEKKNNNTKFVGFYMDEKSDKSKNPKDYEWHKIKD